MNCKANVRARSVAARGGLVLLACLGAARAAAQWPQWGGPARDFTCASGKLAERWPEGGPRELWSRAIGTGHSSIVVDDGRLYTMYREGEQDVVLAVDARSGENVWETKYDAPTRPDMQLEYGAGPHSTPLIVGARLYTIGGLTHLHCLDKRTGAVLWAHNLLEEQNTSHMQRGYGASPIAYGDLVIVPTGVARGQEGAGVTAFRQDTGEVAWKCPEFGAGYASPILAALGGVDHLVIAPGAHRAGLDPATGAVRWQTQVDTQSYGIMTTPVWIAPDKLFCTAGYGGGTRLFQVKPGAEGFTIEELWHYRQMQVMHGTVAVLGDMVVGSSGNFGSAFVMAIDLATGKPLWRERGFGKANVLHADGKLILLDEEGWLALATATRDGLEVHSKAQVLERFAWTVPTLVDDTLYLRDNRTMKALDLGVAGNRAGS